MHLTGSVCGQVVDPVNMVMNLQVTQNVWNLISSVLLASQGGLFSEVSKNASRQASTFTAEGRTYNSSPLTEFMLVSDMSPINMDSIPVM